MSKFKLLVASCVPDPEGLSQEPVHYAAGLVLPLSDEDGARAVAQGAAVPFGHDGCPECSRQGRPCTIECWRGAGGEDADYFPAMVAHEDRKREAAFRARSQPSQEPEEKDESPVVEIIPRDLAPGEVLESAPNPPGVTSDPVSPPVSKGRKPSETPPAT